MAERISALPIEGIDEATEDVIAAAAAVARDPNLTVRLILPRKDGLVPLAQALAVIEGSEVTVEQDRRIVRFCFRARRQDRQRAPLYGSLKAWMARWIRTRM
jgi:hypothetical protein